MADVPRNEDVDRPMGGAVHVGSEGFESTPLGVVGNIILCRMKGCPFRGESLEPCEECGWGVKKPCGSGRAMIWGV
jgi:hypothetical protein